MFWDFFVHPRVFNSCYLSSVPFPFFLKKKKIVISTMWIKHVRFVSFFFFKVCFSQILKSRVHHFK